MSKLIKILIESNKIFRKYEIPIVFSAIFGISYLITHIGCNVFNAYNSPGKPNKEISNPQDESQNIKLWGNKLLAI